jgi:hypothetical protein
MYILFWDICKAGFRPVLLGKAVTLTEHGILAAAALFGFHVQVASGYGHPATQKFYRKGTIK